MSIVPEEESLQSISIGSPDIKDNSQQQLQQHRHLQEHRGVDTFPATRNRTIQTLSAIQAFGTIDVASSTEKITLAKTNNNGSQTQNSGLLTFGKTSTLPPNYHREAHQTPGFYQTGKGNMTTFQQKPLPRSQSYNGSNLYNKHQQSQNSSSRSELNPAPVFKFSFPPPPPEQFSGNPKIGTRTIQYGSHDTPNHYNTLPKAFPRGEGDGAVVPDDFSSGIKTSSSNSQTQSSPNQPPGEGSFWGIF